MTFNEVRGRLLEELAVLLGDEDNPVGDRDVSRRWEGLLYEEADWGRRFLRQWTTVRNYVDDSSPANPMVENPLASGRQLLGIFRCGPVKLELMEELEQQSPQRFALVQELLWVADLSVEQAGPPAQSDQLDEDAFTLTRTRTRTGQETPLADSEVTPQEPGEVRGLENAVDPRSGTFRTMLRRAFAKLQGDAGASASHEAFQSSATAEARNVVAQPALPTEQTPGIIYSLRRRLNAFLRWDVEASTQTAVKQEWHDTWPSTWGGDVHDWKGRNVTYAEYVAALAVADLTPTTQNSVSRSMNPFRLWDYSITKAPRGGGGGGGGTKAIEVEWTGFEIRTKTVNAVVYMRSEFYYYGTKQHPHEDTVRDWLEAETRRREQNRIEPLGRWGFRATYRTLGAIGEWTSNETEVPTRPAPPP